MSRAHVKSLIWQRQEFGGAAEIGPGGSAVWSRLINLFLCRPHRALIWRPEFLSCQTTETWKLNSFTSWPNQRQGAFSWPNWIWLKISQNWLKYFNPFLLIRVQHFWPPKQARKPRSHASPKLRLTDSLTHLLTGVKCRATSVAKKNADLVEVGTPYQPHQPH